MNFQKLSLLAFLIAANAHAADLKIDLSKVSVTNAVHLVYAELNKSNYVLDPEIVNDQRLISFRYSSEKPGLKPFLTNFLNSLGYSITEKSKIDFIHKTETDEQKGDSFFYKPNYRSVNYLTRTLSPFFTGKFTNTRQIPASENGKVKADAPEGSAASFVETEADVLSFNGTREQIEKLKTMLSKIDTRAAQVIVEAAVLEVGKSQNEASSIKQITDLFSGSLTISSGVNLNQNTGVINVKIGSFAAALENLSNLSNFKILSSPRLTIKSGEVGTFSSGQDVPTIGSTSFQNGTPVQSIDYRASGVIFKIKPTIFEKSIDLSVDQEISDFVQTQNGVNGSPTLTKRGVSTQINLRDGELIVLGGLSDQKTMSSNSSFFGFNTGKENKKSDSQIILVLKAHQVSDPS